MSSMNNIVSVDQKRLLSMMGLCFKANQPLFSWGSPGIGKSDLHRAFTASVKGVICDVRLAQYDAVDIRGLPDSRDNTTIWHPPSTLPLAGNPGWPTDRPIVLFLDEMMQAAPAVQSVAFQLVLEGRIGEHELMPNVRVFAASNRETDRAGVQKMLLPLANRFMHVNLEPSLEGWKDWALAAGVNPAIVGYLSFRPDMLDQFEQAIKSGTKAFPTPRVWAKLSQLLEHTRDDYDLMQMTIAAALGEAVGTEFGAFMRSAHKLPSWDQMMEKPDSIKLPSEPDMNYALVSLMANRVRPDTAEPCITIAERLPEEYAVMWMADTCRRAPDLVIQSPALLQYQTEMHKFIHGS